jgi:hypothetical protein
MIRRWNLPLRQATFILISDFRIFVLTLLIAFSIIPRLNAQYKITFGGDVAVKMRDGVILRADIYHPAEAPSVPSSSYAIDWQRSFGPAGILAMHSLGHESYYLKRLRL